MRQCFFLVLFAVPPTIKSAGPSERAVVLHKPVTLQCIASGIPSPSITWLKDGQPVNTARGNIRVSMILLWDPNHGRWLRCSKLYMFVLLFLSLLSHCNTKVLKSHPAERGAFCLIRVVSQVIAVFSRLNPTRHLVSEESMTGNSQCVSFQLYLALQGQMLICWLWGGSSHSSLWGGVFWAVPWSLQQVPVIPFSWWDPTFPQRALPRARMFRGWVLAVALIPYGWSCFWYLACSLLCLSAPHQPGLLTPVQLLMLLSQGNLWKAILVPWAGVGRRWAWLCPLTPSGCAGGGGVTRLLSVFGNSWRPRAVSCNLARPCLEMPPATPAWPPTLRGRPSSTPGSTSTVTRPNGAVHAALAPGLTLLWLFSWLCTSTSRFSFSVPLH